MSEEETHTDPVDPTSAPTPPRSGRRRTGWTTRMAVLVSTMVSLVMAAGCAVIATAATPDVDENARPGFVVTADATSTTSGDPRPDADAAQTPNADSSESIPPEAATPQAGTPEPVTPQAGTPEPVTPESVPLPWRFYGGISPGEVRTIYLDVDATVAPVDGVDWYYDGDFDRHDRFGPLDRENGLWHITPRTFEVGGEITAEWTDETGTDWVATIVVPDVPSVARSNAR